MRRFAWAPVAVGALLFPAAAGAQDRPLSQLLTRFFSPDNPLVLRDTGHTAHFQSQNEARDSLAALNRNIAYQLNSFPLGSSSGGFTFTLDPGAGVLTRSAESFGPLFAERGITAGKRKLTVGANYLHNTFDRFEGKDLDDGSISLVLTHADTDGSRDTLTPFFEGDIIPVNLFLTLKTDTIATFANYGVTDRFDIGIAVPFVSVKMNAQADATIDRLATAGDPFLFHEFITGGTQASFFEDGEASGIGDIVLRAKANVLHAGWGDLALATDIRLPTGDDENLLGAGATQAKFFLIASGDAHKRFSPHVNLGYTFTGDSDTLGTLPDEVDYTLGFDAAVGRKVTFNADFVGRSLLDAQRVVETERTFVYTRRGPIVPQSTTRTILTTETGTLNLLLGALGLKFNPSGRLLFSANVLISLSKDNGLQDMITPVFAIDYNF